MFGADSLSMRHRPHASSQSGRSQSAPLKTVPLSVHLPSPRLFFLIAIAVTLPAAASAQPTMYYNTHPVPPRWVTTPLPGMHFSWAIEWSASNTTAYLIGTFNYTVGDQYVSIGTKSDSKMDGLCIICYIPSSGVASCVDWMGQGYHVNHMTSLTTVISSYYSSSGGVQQVVFSRVVYQDGVDLGVAAWSSHARVIWAWGPVHGGQPKTHPGQGIAANLINFQTGEVVVVPNPNTHLVPVAVFIVYVVVLILAVQLTLRYRVQVHHHVRFGVGLLSAAVGFGLWVWFILASENDYTAMGRLLPIASAMGDAGAACLGALLVTGSRRFINQDLLTVSHERMVFITRSSV